MVPATEFATLPLAVGAEVEDLSSEAGKVWHSSLDTVSQQDGFQRLYWGREVENDNVLNLFIGKTAPTSAFETVYRPCVPCAWDCELHNIRPVKSFSGRSLFDTVTYVCSRCKQ